MDVGLRHILMTLAGWAALGAIVDADTLVLRDGRRVEGTLLSVRDGVVDFEARRGFSGRERIRLDRENVVRIEFDDPRDRPGGDAGGRPSGLRERDVRVDARQGWTDTGVDVRGGQTVYFDATGRVRWGPSRQDGPEGEHGSPRNDSRPIPSRPAAALIGRVGETTDYFFIGEAHDGIRMRGSGRLFLGVNDDYLNDNSGAFSVTVLY
jgi:hypothetical protein